MGSTRMGVPIELVNRACAALNLVAAVETGTYLGDSALALRGFFPEVWSIELSEPLFTAAKERYGGRPGMHFVHGRSEEVLPSILERIDGASLFWLDGHWSGGLTSGSDHECPILDEISAIDASPFASESCILIDDARLFLGPP